MWHSKVALKKEDTVYVHDDSQSMKVAIFLLQVNLYYECVGLSNKSRASSRIWCLHWPEALHEAEDSSRGSPTRLMRNLIGVFFTKEVLASSSAYGGRKNKALDQDIMGGCLSKYLYI